MPNIRIDPLCKSAISDNRTVFCSALFLHGDHIVTVGLEPLAAVRFDTILAIAFEGRGESLGLFSRALFCPRWFNGERGGVRLALFPIKISNTRHDNIYPAHTNVGKAADEIWGTDTYEACYFPVVIADETSSTDAVISAGIGNLDQVQQNIAK